MELRISIVSVSLEQYIHTQTINDSKALASIYNKKNTHLKRNNCTFVMQIMETFTTLERIALAVDFSIYNVFRKVSVCLYNTRLRGIIGY